MTPEEFCKAQGMLHPLEGMELYLDVLKDKAKALKGIDARHKGEYLLSIQTLERVRRQLLGTVQDLLSGSEKVEAERQAKGLAMLNQTRAQARAEALDHLAEAIAEQRRAAEEEMPAPAGARKRPGRVKERGSFL